MRDKLPTLLKGLVILLSFIGIGWGLTIPPMERQSSPLPSTFYSKSKTLAGASPLPRAWESPGPSPFPTWTLPPTFKPTSLPPSSTPTIGLTPTQPSSPTPTASPTPIHKPADQDPTRITIPAIGLDAKVVTVGTKTIQESDGRIRTVWEVADNAAGFHQGSARPGHTGNTVISGHNNIKGKVFQDLYKLQPGDDIYLWVNDCPYHYKVNVVYRLPFHNVPQKIIEENMRWIMPTDDQRLTLVTCWPPWSNTHRIVVVAFPAP